MSELQISGEVGMLYNVPLIKEVAEGNLGEV